MDALSNRSQENPDRHMSCVRVWLLFWTGLDWTANGLNLPPDKVMGRNCVTQHVTKHENIMTSVLIIVQFSDEFLCQSFTPDFQQVSFSELAKKFRTVSVLFNVFRINYQIIYQG